MRAYECALWFARHHVPDYDLFDDEAAAASYAVFMEDDCAGIPLGVQFADGRTIAAEDWPALPEARRRRAEDDRRRREEIAARPPRVTRNRRAPFTDGRTVQIDASEPEWLGLPPKEDRPCPG